MTRQIRETAEVSLRTFVEAVSKADKQGVKKLNKLV